MTTNARWIPTHLLNIVKTKIDRLTRKAAQIGAPIGFQITDETEDREIGNTRKFYVNHTKVIATTGDVKFAGWTLVARLLHENQTGVAGQNIINEVPGQTCPAEFRTVACKCDHCGKNWIRRNDTYVVRHEDGTHKQVGANCVADFLGHSTPDAVVSMYEMLTGIDAAFATGEAEEVNEGGWRRGVMLADVDEVLALVAAHVRKFGWTTGAAAAASGGTKGASVHGIETALFPRSNDDYKWAAQLAPTPDDVAMAATARAWIAANTDRDNNYLCNLQALASAKAVGVRTLGMLCSLITAYQRAMQKKAERDARPESNHIGTVGNPVVADVRVVYVRSFETSYGVSHKNVMVDDAGNTLVWWTGTVAYEVGDTMRIKGTVKSHGEYNGRKETVLTRCKELPSDAEAAQLAALSAAAETMLANLNHCSFFAEDSIRPVVDELLAAGYIELEERTGNDANGQPVQRHVINLVNRRLAQFAGVRKEKKARKTKAA